MPYGMGGEFKVDNNCPLRTITCQEEEEDGRVKNHICRIYYKFVEMYTWKGKFNYNELNEESWGTKLKGFQNSC